MTSVDSTTMLTLKDVCKSYVSGTSEIDVLERVSFELPPGATCSLVGPSGSGKTTLLSVCAGLDTIDSGSVQLCGSELTQLSEDERARLRAQHVGFVFQSFQLLPSLTALENVMVPAELVGRGDARERAVALLEDVGLGARCDHYPAQLSGGEKQRVAIARAYINTPQMLFADEPTGNLDPSTAAHIEELLFKLNREQNTTLLMATHNMELAAKTEMVFRVADGGVHIQ